MELFISLGRFMKYYATGKLYSYPPFPMSITMSHVEFKNTDVDFRGPGPYVRLVDRCLDNVNLTTTFSTGHLYTTPTVTIVTPHHVTVRPPMSPCRDKLGGVDSFKKCEVCVACRL